MIQVKLVLRESKLDESKLEKSLVETKIKAAVLCEGSQSTISWTNSDQKCPESLQKIS